MERARPVPQWAWAFIISSKFFISTASVARSSGRRVKHHHLAARVRERYVARPDVERVAGVVRLVSRGTAEADRPL